MTYKSDTGGTTERAVAGGCYAVTELWGPLGARFLLGLVLLWFGYHEATDPGLWTGYVPLVSETSAVAKVLVLAHGCMLTVLAVAILVGILPRAAAGVSALLLAEIVVSLTATAGLSDLVLRDVGVLGLAVAIFAVPQRRLVLVR